MNSTLSHAKISGSTPSANSSALARNDGAPATEIPVVIPVFNEEENIQSLHEKLRSALDARVKLIRFRRNFGQTAAMVAGMDFSRARVTEIPVRHHPRIAGKSKYGMNRIFKVMLDLLVVKFLGGYGSKPIYFFGGAGLWSGALGVLCWLITFAQKLLQADHHINRDPLFYTGILLFVAALQFLIMGLISEMNMRIYYEAQNKAPYVVAEKINLGNGENT